MMLSLMMWMLSAGPVAAPTPVDTQPDLTAWEDKADDVEPEEGMDGDDYPWEPPTDPLEGLDSDGQRECDEY